jgi:hypothetical protein
MLDSVIQVGESYAPIHAGIAAALRKRVRPGCSSVYGDGRAGARSARILAELPLGDALARKVITY